MVVGDGWADRTSLRQAFRVADVRPPAPAGQTPAHARTPGHAAYAPISSPTNAPPIRNGPNGIAVLRPALRRITSAQP